MIRCSECSHEVKPIVCVDIDGTLAEYHNHLGRHVCNYFGLPWPTTYVPVPTSSPPTSWNRGPQHWDGKGNYEDWFGITQAQYREAKLAFRQGGFKRWAPVMPGVDVLMETLGAHRRQGEVEVWITTTRPWNRLDSTDPDTRFWLDQHFPIYDHLLYDDDKYNRLCEIVDKERVVAVIDDLPEQVRAAAWAFGEHAVMMADRPHNKHEYVPRRGDLMDFAVMAHDNIKEYWGVHS